MTHQTCPDGCYVENLIDQYTGSHIQYPDGDVMVRGGNNAAYTLTAGVLDDRAVEAFTSGQCHALAFALHTQTGWPLAFVSDGFCSLDEDLCCPEDIDPCTCQLLHVVVRAPDGRYLDIRGLQTSQELLRCYGDDGYTDCEVIDDHELTVLQMARILRDDHMRRPAIELASEFARQLLARTA